MRNRFGWKNERKGFTLIEIIVVVVIVAILAALIIPAISRYVKSGKDRYHKELENQLVLVGKDYYASNPRELPENGKIKQVWLPFLRSNNYTSEEFKDADGGDCTNSYVRVEKSEGNYYYIPCLKCKNYSTDNPAYCNLNDTYINVETNDNQCDEVLSPECTISVSDSGFVITPRYHTSEECSNNSITGVKINGVSYLPNGSGIVEYKTSNLSTQFTANVYDSIGKSGSCSIDNRDLSCTWKVGAFSDKDEKPIVGNPKVGSSVYYKLECRGAEGNLVSEPTASNVKINESAFSGLRLVESNKISDGMSYTFSVTASAVGRGSLTLPAGVVKDSTGHVNKMSESSQVWVVPVNVPTVDNDNPTCDVIMTKVKDNTRYYEGEWSNQDVRVSVTNCYDSSGIGSVSYSPSQTISKEGETTVNINVCDVASPTNCTLYNKTIKIDKTPPTCNVSNITMRKYKGYGTSNPTYVESYSNAHWTQNPVRVDFDSDNNCSDNVGGSGLDKGETYMTQDHPNDCTKCDKYLDVIAEGKSTVTIHAQDKAGNVYTYTRSVYRDTTPPSCSFSPSPNNAIESGTTVTMTCTDANGFSGISHISHAGTPIGSNGTYSGTTCTESVTLKGTGNYPIMGACVDKAGNSGTANATYTFKAACKNPKESWVSSCTPNSTTTCEPREKKVTYSGGTLRYYWDEIPSKSGGSKGNVSLSTASQWCKNNGYSADLSSCGTPSSSNWGKTCLDATGAGGSKVTCKVSQCKRYYTGHSVSNSTYVYVGSCVDTSSKATTSSEYVVCSSGYYKKTVCE